MIEKLTMDNPSIFSFYKVKQADLDVYQPKLEYKQLITTLKEKFPNKKQEILELEKDIQNVLDSTNQQLYRYVFMEAINDAFPIINEMFI